MHARAAQQLLLKMDKTAQKSKGRNILCWTAIFLVVLVVIVIAVAVVVVAVVLTREDTEDAGQQGKELHHK